MLLLRTALCSFIVDCNTNGASMSSPLNVDPDQLDGAGGRWVFLIPELQGTPPAGGTGGWPSTAGASAVTGTAGESTGALQDGLRNSAGLMQNSGDAYKGQEKQNTEAMPAK